MKPAQDRHRDVKDDDSGHQTSSEETVREMSRDRSQQGGGHRSGSSGAGTSEKVDREPERRGPGPDA